MLFSKDRLFFSLLSMAFLTLLALPGWAQEMPTDEATPVQTISEAEVSEIADTDSSAVEEAGLALDAELTPDWMSFGEETALAGACFPPTLPPASCECGTCCECNKCWRNGVVVRMLCGP